MAGEGSDFFSSVLAELTPTHYVLVGTLVVGLLGVLYMFLKVSGRRPEHEEKGGSTASEGEEESGGEQENVGQRQKKQPKIKGLKSKPTRKITLPSHPLLAAEFKGHTGSVLSLDCDINGKYMASCSEGEWRNVVLA